MQYEIHDESEQGRFVIAMAGPFTIKDHVSMLKELIYHPNWKKGMNLVVDGRSIVLDDFDVEEIKTAASMVNLVRENFHNSRHAIICPDEGAFKVGTFNYLLDNTVGWTSRLFEKEEFEDALAWVNQTDSLRDPDG